VFLARRKTTKINITDVFVARETWILTLYTANTRAIKHAGCRIEEEYEVRTSLPGNEGRTSVTVLG